MKKASVMVLRDTMLDASRIEVFADNVRLYDDSNKFVELIWDDQNELLHCLRTNQSHYDQNKKPFVVESFEYDVIQYMFNKLDRDELKVLLEKMLNRGLIDETRLNNIIESFSQIDNKLL